MIGKLLAEIVKVATLPIDIGESVIDIVVGGDGSKESKKDNFNPLSDIRDGICKGIEDLDN